MPRRGRYFLSDQPLHVIQRGNDRQAIFFAAADYGKPGQSANYGDSELR